MIKLIALAKASAQQDAEPVALYTAWSDEEELLYLGTSSTPQRRWKQHAKEKPWWGSVSFLDCCWLPSRPAAERLEQVLISEHCPVNNRSMPPWYLGVTRQEQDRWNGAFNVKADAAFTDLSEGQTLAKVASRTGWHPRYLIRLGRQRRIPWAMGYVGPFDDLPQVGYVPHAPHPGRQGEALMTRERY